MAGRAVSQSSCTFEIFTEATLFKVLPSIPMDVACEFHPNASLEDCCLPKCVFPERQSVRNGLRTALTSHDDGVKVRLYPAKD